MKYSQELVKLDSTTSAAAAAERTWHDQGRGVCFFAATAKLHALLDGCIRYI